MIIYYPRIVVLLLRWRIFLRDKKLDDLNIKLLKSLEQDSRRSLKELAADLNIKTSTIYHRLHRLKETKVLEGFSIIVNPDEMNLSVFNFLTVSLKNLNVKRLDRMFIESFAQYLAKEFDEILFVSTSRTKIYLISCHISTTGSEEFLDKIRAIPYVDNIDIVQFDKIIKGHRLFTFRSEFFTHDSSGKEEEEGVPFNQIYASDLDYYEEGDLDEDEPDH